MAMAETGDDFYLYAFLAVGVTATGDRVLKVGRTACWERRRREYCGLEQPDETALLVCRTASPIRTEKMIKRVLREFLAVHSGYERFVVPRATDPEPLLEWIGATIALHASIASPDGLNPTQANHFKRKLTSADDRHMNTLEFENVCLRRRLGAIDVDAQVGQISSEIGSAEWRELPNRTGNADDDQPSPDPIDLRQLVDVRQMMRIYLTHVAPKERDGKAWRQTAAVGRKKMQALSRRIECQYEPVLFAVMKRHVDDGVPILDAIQAIEASRGADWKFIDEKKKSLVGQDDMNDEARKRYRQRLLEPDFAVFLAQAGLLAAKKTRVNR